MTTQASKRQIVFDIETTGLRFEDGHKTVEIGAVELLDGVPTGLEFHAYVNPDREVPEEAIAVHGLTYETLKKHKMFADESKAPAFLKFVNGAELIAHNGRNFDVPFLNAELHGCGLPELTNELVDTLEIARRKFPGSPVSLNMLCSRFGISTAERDAKGHGALLDSQLLAEVYLELSGGRQRGLTFERPTADKPTLSKTTNEVTRSKSAGRIPLATEKELQDHAAFIKELGLETTWDR